MTHIEIALMSNLLNLTYILLFCILENTNLCKMCIRFFTMKKECLLVKKPWCCPIIIHSTITFQRHTDVVIYVTNAVKSTTWSVWKPIPLWVLLYLCGLQTQKVIFIGYSQTNSGWIIIKVTNAKSLTTVTMQLREWTQLMRIIRVLFI